MAFILPFSKIRLADLPQVGGKNCSLGEMVNALTDLGVQVPNGFAVTADAYRHFLRENDLEERIEQVIKGLDPTKLDQLEQVGSLIRQWIRSSAMPDDLAAEIRAAYNEREQEYGTNYDVAVRSSATAEDLPDASFAGQQETFLNVRTSTELIEKVRRVYASLYTNRAISYRAHTGYGAEEIAISVGVQKMVRADRGCAGVMFTLDTETGFRDLVLINGAYGLGENVVQGAVNPDEWHVYKPGLRANKRPILRRRLGEKAIKMVYDRDPDTTRAVHNVAVLIDEQKSFCLSDEEVEQLARFALVIEDHYSKERGKPTPMDIEWAKDGLDGQLYILQARPETVHSRRTGYVHENFKLLERGPIVVEGRAVGKRIGSGKARVILDSENMHEVHPGDVLVTDITDPDWEPVMKTASAIVTNRGGRTCHAAIIARELGIPAIVGCGDATELIKMNQDVTVSCAEGETGFVYSGILPFESESIDLEGRVKPKTKLYLNVGDPQQALNFSGLPADGVGLARLEFIINNSIKVHPQALLDFDGLDAETREKIEPIIAGYPSPRDYFVRRLAEGVATIAAAFHPRPVVVRMSDFKSNEYAALLGGTRYEPFEENPMLGWRGASRYFSEQFSEAFAMECAALKGVREEMGLDNVILMLPFVRTVEEGKAVLEKMADYGLVRGENGLKVYLMCELPSNAILAHEFLEHFDGFSIGSNDMTQLALGVDRDSGMLTGYDERNPAVLALMELAIKACQEQGKYIGICGQAPSDFPEITQWLVERGIDSISLNPDSLVHMMDVVLAEEKAIAAKKT
ncbi:MAG: phosphoenolpyruvate synthase [Planctomycetota bacterium]|nr:phosphoenolpyruvate synthase [Planctomycetota bacterium]MDA1112755.1 phosphoenolpyruvate synthase [Planctomycetota bacterium]